MHVQSESPQLHDEFDDDVDFVYHTVASLLDVLASVVIDLSFS